MNDNTSIETKDWIEIVEQEWGFRPISCMIDAERQTVVAIFSTPLRVTGDMRIMGCTIIPKTSMPAAEHPFNAERRHVGQRVRIHGAQNTL